MDVSVRWKLHEAFGSVGMFEAKANETRVSHQLPGARVNNA